MQCGNGELRSGDKLLDALHASVVFPFLDLRCWFCSVGWTQTVLPWLHQAQLGKDAGLGCVFFHGLAISPSEVCSATCGPSPGYLYTKSAGIVLVEGRQRRREIRGKEMTSPFLLTAVPAVVSFAVGASKQLMCGPGHSSMSPPLLCLAGAPVRRSPTAYFLWPASVPTNHSAPSICREETMDLHCWDFPTAVLQQSCLSRQWEFHPGLLTLSEVHCCTAVLEAMMAVGGCVRAPCWSNALDRRHWPIQAGPHPHSPSFPPPGNTTCKRHRDATVLTTHRRHAVRLSTGAAPRRKRWQRAEELC